MTDVATEAQPFVRLSYSKGEDAQGALLAVRWEISSEALAEIKRRNIESPYILLVVVHDNEELRRERVIRPLDEGMAHVAVPKQGISTIYGILTYRTYDVKKLPTDLDHLYTSDIFSVKRRGERELDDQIEDLEQQCDNLKRDRDLDSGLEHSEVPEWSDFRDRLEALYEQRRSLPYDDRVVYIELTEPRRNRYRPYRGFSVLGSAAEVQVEISAQDLAKEHPVLEKISRILPWWWHHKQHDECRLGWRLGWTFLLSPLWILGYIATGAIVAAGYVIARIIMLVLAVLLLWTGIRGTDYRQLIRPTTINPLEIVGDDDEDLVSRWNTERVPDESRRGYKYVLRRRLWRVVNPVTIVSAGLVVFVALAANVYFALIPFAVLVFALVVLGAFEGLGAPKPGEPRKPTKQEVKFERQVASLSDLVYQPGSVPAPATLAALPPSKRTFRQRLMAHKQDHCKPFAM